MKRLLCLLALIPLLSLADHPHKCPSTKAIKDMGINKRLFEDSDGHWYGGRSSLKYDTEYLWTFVMLDVKAKTNNEAYAKASLALKILTFQSGPTQGRNEDEVYCQYQAGKYSAVTIYPPFSDIPKIGWLHYSA